MQRADEQPLLAERIRQALIECAAAAHEDARLQGLCCEGAWEAATSAMRALDLAQLTSRLAATEAGSDVEDAPGY
jgi:hypothetical protein